jgi:hypothetical protein
MSNQIEMPDGLRSDLPDQLNFHLPNDTTKTSFKRGENGLMGVVKESVVDFHPPTDLDFDDTDNLYRQLVCWCLVQRFWYFVMKDPKFTDLEYDFIEAHVAKIEAEFPHLKEANRYTPTKTVGSSMWWDRSYPDSIRRIFSSCNRFNQMCKEGEARVRASWQGWSLRSKS